MAGFVMLHCSVGTTGEWPFRAVLDERPKKSDFNGFGDCEGIFQLNAEIAHRTVHLGVTQ